MNSLFPGAARAQPLPLPLGPAYNTSDFKAYVNITFQMSTDQPASGFAVNQSFLSLLVNQLGQLYYPQGVLFEVGPFIFHFCQSFPAANMCMPLRTAAAALAACTADRITIPRASQMSACVASLPGAHPCMQACVRRCAPSSHGLHGMPSPVPMQVLDLVAANANDSMVDCTIPVAGGNWGICASMLMMLQDDTKATFVKSTLVNVVRASN